MLCSIINRILKMEMQKQVGHKTDKLYKAYTLSDNTWIGENELRDRLPELLELFERALTGSNRP